MGSSKKIVSGVIWSTFVNVINALYGFIAVPILINHFGKAEYGLIGLAMSVNVYMNLMDMGFNSTNVRFFSTWLAQNRHERLLKGFQTSLSFYSVIGLINAIVLLIVAFFSKEIFNVTIEQDSILKHLFYILAISAFCQWFSSCFDQIIKATENVAWIQKRTLLTKILMILVLGSTVWFDFSIELYFILTCLAQLAIVPMSVGMIRRQIPYIRFMPKWDKQSFREMLPYCMNIFSFSLFQFSFYNLRPVFLGIQGSVESVADYRILNGIIGVVTMLGGAFVGILLPSTSKIVAMNDKEAYYRVAYDGTKYISILICLCCFGMMTVGSEVLILYVGKSYLYLIPWFNLWLLCTLGTHNQAISSLILAGSDIRAISYSSVVASAVGLILSWVLIPKFAIGGVCIAFTIYMLIQMLFYYCYYWPVKMYISSLRIFIKCFLPYVILGAILYGVLHRISLDMPVLAIFFVKGFAFLFLYVLITFFLLNKSVKLFLSKIIKKK